MILGVILRSYKSYRGWNYVELTNGDYFTGIIGDNGVGKSSILEALDIFFNKPKSEWNYNNSINKSGFENREPEICPIFLLEKKKINKQRNIYKSLEILTNHILETDKNQLHSAHGKLFTKIFNQIKIISQHGHIDLNDYFIMPIGFKRENKTTTEKSFSFLESSDESPILKTLREIQIEKEEFHDQVYDLVSELYDYIYIPSEIDYVDYTKIEGKAIQSLMGTTVDEIIKEIVNDSSIKEINSGLDSFLERVQKYLIKYEYKKPSKKQTLFNINHLSSKIIETYFESKVLNLKSNEASTPIYDLSSGEKRKALLDLVEAFIANSSRDLQKKSLIIAVDEPEISLNISACFSQFEKLDKVSQNGIQTFASTHWYGFFPSVSNGSAIYINSEGDEHSTCIINLHRFREDIKKIKIDSKGKMPNIVELKSINDIVQAIISSITSTDSKWIICEGTSDKYYLDHYLKNKDIKTVSVGGSKYVKKAFEHFYLALEEDRDSILGKVFFLLDTDKKFESYPSKTSISNFSLKRIQNNFKGKKIELKTTQDNSFHPPTVIEDSLNWNAYLEALKEITKNMKEYDFLHEAVLIEEALDNNCPSGIAFDWRSTEKEKIDSFFSLPKKKVEFARAYASHAIQHPTPKWINDICTFFEE